MPTYEFKCDFCSNVVEIKRSVEFASDPYYCPTCGDVMRKIYSPAAVIFKGSGFYRTDK